MPVNISIEQDGQNVASLFRLYYQDKGTLEIGSSIHHGGTWPTKAKLEPAMQVDTEITTQEQNVEDEFIEYEW